MGKNIKKFEPPSNPDKVYTGLVDNQLEMETEWTTVSKRNKAPPQPRKTHSEAFVEDVRANKVYAKREFPAGVTISKPVEPMVAKGGSVFSSRLRQEVEQARVPSPADTIRDTVSFEATTKPSPYKNAALNAVKQEKIRQANAAIAAVTAKSETSNPILQPLSYRSNKPPLIRVDEYSFQPDEDPGFDDTEAVRTRKTRVQPTTEKFQSVSRVSRVTTIHKSAIDIIEPAEDDAPPDNGTEQPDYE